MKIEFTNAYGKEFKEYMYKPYTTRSKEIDFIVWPVLRLYENGPIAAKGIAQGLTDRNKRLRRPGFVRKKNFPPESRSWKEMIPITQRGICYSKPIKRDQRPRSRTNSLEA
jgi:hypothetical protein